MTGMRKMFQSVANFIKPGLLLHWTLRIIRMARSQCNKKNSDILVESGATCFRCIQIWRLYWSWSPRDDWPVIDIAVVVYGSRLILVNLRSQFRRLNWEIMLPLLVEILWGSSSSLFCLDSHSIERSERKGIIVMVKYWQRLLPNQPGQYSVYSY